MKLKVWLDSGANISSSHEQIVEIANEEWDALSLAEQEECTKDIAFNYSDWGYKVIEE